MKLKLLKKLMIICMSFSLSVSMVPASVLAAGKDSSEGDTQAVQVISSDTESESANTETETKNQETKHHKDKETEIKGGFVPESESQAVIESEAVITEQASQTEGEAGQKKGAVGKKTRDIANKDGCDIIDGVLTVTGNEATIVMNNGESVSEVRVDAGKTLHVYLLGTETNTIDKITGEGTVILEKGGSEGTEVSNGKLSVSGEISVANLTVNGGTLLGSAEITSTNIVYTQGAIACKVKSGSTVKSSSGSAKELKKLTLSVGKADVPCVVSGITVGGSVKGESIVWSDADGKVTVYVDNLATAKCIVQTYETKIENKSDLTITTENWTYASGNMEVEDTATSSVTVGGDVTSTYGEETLSNKTIVKVTDKNDYITSVKMNAKNYDSSMDDALKVESVSDGLGGYKITKNNKYQIPTTEEYKISKVTVKDKLGYEHTLSGTVNYTVEKKVLTPSVVPAKSSTTSQSKITKTYDGTTEAADACKLSGFVNTETQDANEISKAVAAGGSVGAYFKTATYTYDSSDVATASKVTVTLEFKEGSDLDKKYTIEPLDISAEITKAPLTEKLMKSLGITLTKPEVTERHYQYLKYKTVAGQEYAYSEKAKDDEWKLAKKASTITYVNEVDGEEQDLKAGTSYKIYTRIPESDNYLASDPVSVSVKTLRAPQEAKESDVKFTGVTDNSTQKLNTALTFTATGSTYVDDKNYKPSADDEKYVPYSWKLTDTTTWKGDKSTQTFTMTPTQAGTYTIVATFRKYVYDGKKWVYSEGDDVKKSITFKANESGTSSSTSGSGSSSSSSSGSTNTAAKTGDTTPVVPVAAALVVSGAALALTLKKRKKEEK